jgi:hypothetical protein
LLHKKRNARALDIVKNQVALVFLLSVSFSCISFGAEAPARPSLIPTPKPTSRDFSAADRRLIWNRSRGQCEFISPKGLRCSARNTLQIDTAFALRGLFPTGVRPLWKKDGSFAAAITTRG